MNEDAQLTLEQLDALLAERGEQSIHDDYCDFATITVTGPNGYETVHCPHCERQRQLGALQTAGVPERYIGVTWEDLEMVAPLPDLRAAGARIDHIVRSGHSLILAGPPGTGKTQGAALLAWEAISAGYRVAFANIGRVAMDVRAGYDGDGTSESREARRLSQVHFLVLDDIGAGEAGEGKIEKRLLYFITEARQNARLPTVITSNLSAKELLEFLGERIMNRLMPVEVVNFTHGRNFRRPKEATLWAPPSFKDAP